MKQGDGRKYFVKLLAVFCEFALNVNECKENIPISFQLPVNGTLFISSTIEFRLENYNYSRRLNRAFHCLLHKHRST